MLVGVDRGGTSIEITTVFIATMARAMHGDTRGVAWLGAER